MDDTPALPIVKTKRDVVGSIQFVDVTLAIKGDGDLYETAAMALHFDMMTGETRRPMIITPEMVFPIIANLAAWGARMTHQVGFAPPTPPEDTVSTPGATTSPDPYARREGESRQDWTDRISQQAKVLEGGQQ